jgi:hypothetical protein
VADVFVLGVFLVLWFGTLCFILFSEVRPRGRGRGHRRAVVISVITIAELS